MAGYALGAFQVDLFTAVGKNTGGVYVSSLLTAWFAEPIERQRNTNNREHHQVGAQGKIQAFAFKVFVADIIAAVSGKFDLRAHLAFGSSNVEEEIYESTNKDDRQNDESDCSRGGSGEQHENGERLLVAGLSDAVGPFGFLPGGVGPDGGALDDCAGVYGE